MKQVKTRKRSKRKTRRRNIYATANYLIRELKKDGIVIQRYNSKTSNSIYLKLDYGVLHTIRISDHHGKKHLNYKYNLLTSCSHPTSITNKTSFGEVKQHYFPLREKKLVVDIIQKTRREKIQLYGEKNYQTFMELKIAENYAKTGFWLHGEIV